MTTWKFSNLMKRQQLLKSTNHPANFASSLGTTSLSIFFQLKILLQTGKLFFSSFQSKPNVYLSHEVFGKSNAWAIAPVLIDILNQLIKPQMKWLVLCEAHSVVNWRNLLASLDDEDETKVRRIPIIQWARNLQRENIFKTPTHSFKVH